MFWQSYFVITELFHYAFCCCATSTINCKPRKPAAPLMVCMDLKDIVDKVASWPFCSEFNKSSVLFCRAILFRLSDKFLYDFFHFIVHFMSCCNILLYMSLVLFFGSKTFRISCPFFSLILSPGKKALQNNYLLLPVSAVMTFSFFRLCSYHNTGCVLIAGSLRTFFEEDQVHPCLGMFQSVLQQNHTPLFILVLSLRHRLRPHSNIFESECLRRFLTDPPHGWKIIQQQVLSS